MWESHFAQQLHLGTSTHTEGRCCPLAHSIDGENGGFLKRRAEKRTGGVRHVMTAEQDLIAIDSELAPDQILHPDLVEKPGGHRIAEDLPRPRYGLKGGGENALELHKRLFVENHVIQIAGTDSALLEAELNGPPRKSGVVLLARKALLFGGRNELPIHQQRRSGVMIETGNPQDVHLVTFTADS